jgi:hypothetical protein
MKGMWNYVQLTPKSVPTTPSTFGESDIDRAVILQQLMNDALYYEVDLLAHMGPKGPKVKISRRTRLRRRLARALEDARTRLALAIAPWMCED